MSMNSGRPLWYQVTDGENSISLHFPIKKIIFYVRDDFLQILTKRLESTSLNSRLIHEKLKAMVFSSRRPFL